MQEEGLNDDGCNDHENKSYWTSVLLYGKSLSLNMGNQKGQLKSASKALSWVARPLYPKNKAGSLLPPKTCCAPYTATHIGEFQWGTKAHSTHSTISGTCWQWHWSGCSKVDQVLLQIEEVECFSQSLEHHKRICMILEDWSNGR